MSSENKDSFMFFFPLCMCFMFFSYFTASKDFWYSVEKRGVRGDILTLNLIILGNDIDSYHLT